MRTELDINAPLDHPFPESVTQCANCGMQSVSHAPINNYHDRYIHQHSIAPGGGVKHPYPHYINNDLLNYGSGWGHASHYDYFNSYPGSEPNPHYSQVPAVYTQPFNCDYMIALEKIKASNKSIALDLALKIYKDWPLFEDKHLQTVFELATKFEEYLNNTWKPEDTNRNNQQT